MLVKQAIKKIAAQFEKDLNFNRCKLIYTIKTEHFKTFDKVSQEKY